MAGRIVRVSGPLVVAEGLDDPIMYGVVKVGTLGLFGEIISLGADTVSIQVYEQTEGVGPGEPVAATGDQLSVELGPGLMSQIYDGIQRPLDVISAGHGSFIARGIEEPAIDYERRWEFTAVAQSGSEVMGGTRLGFVATKPNCSIQPYVPALHALAEFQPREVSVCTYQALSGAGKTLETWPEMEDNIIPFIGGEEDKSIREPLKIWGRIEDGRIVEASSPLISAQCVRVPVSDGHLAAVALNFGRKPEMEVVLERWRSYAGRPQKLNLPSAPEPFLSYFEEEDRPQTRLDRDAGTGMGVTLGRLRPDNLFDFRFVALSHNTVRGAAGGAILTAELLQAEGYFHRG